MDVAAFLRQHPPFDGLDDEHLAIVARSALIEFFPAGSAILEQHGQPAAYLYVIRSGAVEILEEGRLVDLASEGEVFGELSMISGAGPSATVRSLPATLAGEERYDSLASAAFDDPYGSC